ncbi:MAG TPA: phospholipase D-like domain-containing protein [Methylomirabilota bacterium]
MLGNAKQFGDSLASDLRDARALSIAVAFAKESALSTVDVEGWCRPGRRIRLLAGTDYALTELQVLRRLESTGSADCRVYYSIGGQMFHPKLYILENERSRIVYVGSSNFTRGGLLANVEANVRLEAAPGVPEIEEPRRIFDSMFGGEFAVPLSPAFESGYRQLQDAVRAARMDPVVPESTLLLRSAESRLLGEYRARVAVARWLLVTSPPNFEICMRERVWGRQQEAEVQRYAPGDVFFFHVTDVSRILMFGIFTGEPFHDPRPLWPSDSRGRGGYPWRIRILPLGILSVGIPTRPILEPLRPGAAPNWFNGFIQQSHTLSEEDFQALRLEFEAALRRQQAPGMI